MSTRPEAVRLNLEFYRKQAKALLKSAQSGDAAALQRLSREIGAPALHDAQFAIAREHGFLSWPRFRAFLIQSRLDFEGLVNAFIDAAVSDYRRASELLAAHPELADAGFYTALVLGNVSRVGETLQESPEMARQKGGPRDWEPILYVCMSRFANGKSGDPTGTAELLLRHGADPNSRYVSKEWPDNPLPCLYGAVGINNNPALALALLKAGANPNDSESLYHSTEHADLACLRLLLEYGASPGATNALNHMLDREDLTGLELLLAAGADPKETNERGETALHWAVLRTRSIPIIAKLLDHGAVLDAKRKDGRSAYALAAHSGQTQVMAFLKARGANTELSWMDQLVSDCSTASLEEAARLTAQIPDITAAAQAHLIPNLAMNHAARAIQALLNAGLAVDARGEMGATGLHWACWKGYADLVKVLLEHGASLTVLDWQFQKTPPGWFCHGVQNCEEAGGDYAEVARLLLGAGAVIPAADLPTERPEVDAVLREHGLIP